MQSVSTIGSRRDEPQDTSITGSIAKIESALNRLAVVENNLDNLWGTLTGSGEAAKLSGASSGAPTPVQPLQSRARAAAESLDVLADRLQQSISQIIQRI